MGRLQELKDLLESLRELGVQEYRSGEFYVNFFPSAPSQPALQLSTSRELEPEPVRAGYKHPSLNLVSFDD